MTIMLPLDLRYLKNAWILLLEYIIKSNNFSAFWITKRFSFWKWITKAFFFSAPKALKIQSKGKKFLAWWFERLVLYANLGKTPLIKLSWLWMIHRFILQYYYILNNLTSIEFVKSFEKHALIVPLLHTSLIP